MAADEFNPSSPPSADGVERAAERLSGKAVETPLLENDVLNEISGGRIFLKAEVLQHCGSFKFRGAYNLISQLSDTDRERGVLAWSSGNHAQGVARAAKMFGVPATIVMPADAPEMKAERVRALGAEIIPYDRYSQDREELALQVQEERQMVLAPSYGHPHIIEGQGTVAMEAVKAVRRAGVELDMFVVCCGGGGLTAGCALHLEKSSPQTQVWIAEPEGFDEAWQSIRTGSLHKADVSNQTICDAIATPSLGQLTFPVMKRLVRGGVTLTEEDVGRAMTFAYKYLKLVVEPGGAVALASILSRKIDVKGKTVAVTLSGGNVDSSLFQSILDRHS